MLDELEQLKEKGTRGFFNMSKIIVFPSFALAYSFENFPWSFSRKLQLEADTVHGKL